MFHDKYIIIFTAHGCLLKLPNCILKLLTIKNCVTPIVIIFVETFLLHKPVSNGAQVLKSSVSKSLCSIFTELCTLFVINYTSIGKKSLFQKSSQFLFNSITCYLPTIKGENPPMQNNKHRLDYWSKWR